MISFFLSFQTFFTSYYHIIHFSIFNFFFLFYFICLFISFLPSLIIIIIIIIIIVREITVISCINSSKYSFSWMTYKNKRIWYYDEKTVWQKKTVSSKEETLYIGKCFALIASPMLIKRWRGCKMETL